MEIILGTMQFSLPLFVASLRLPSIQRSLLYPKLLCKPASPSSRPTPISPSFGFRSMDDGSVNFHQMRLWHRSTDSPLISAIPEILMSFDFENLVYSRNKTRDLGVSLLFSLVLHNPNLLGGAVTLVGYFVRCFLRVPQLFCSIPACCPG